MTDDFAEINQKLQTFGQGTYELTLLPVQTVGVQGDGRSYSYLAGITGPANWNELIQLAREVPKTIHKVNRVVYIFGEPVHRPVTEITPTLLSRPTLDQLRQADQIVNDILWQFELTKRISQVPVVLFPVSFGQPGHRSIGIRTLITRDFMTGLPAVPGKELPEAALMQMVERILNEVPGIVRVVYDLTSKPPATTEWE